MNGEHMYAYDTNSSRANLGSYHVKHAVSVVIKESGDALLITAEDQDMKAMKNGEPKIQFTQDVATKNDGTFSIPVEKANRIVPKFYYSTTEGEFDGEKSFGYRQWNFYLQGMAVPVKFRAPVNKVQRVAETGPTLAFAPGYKHSWNWYTGFPNAVGLSTTSLSVSAGGLIGLGTTDLKAVTTNNLVLDANATKNAIIPVGAHFVVGYNKINFGFALGTDVILGPNRKHWIYKDKIWTGIIIGLDIVK